MPPTCSVRLWKAEFASAFPACYHVGWQYNLREALMTEQEYIDRIGTPDGVPPAYEWGGDGKKSDSSGTARDIYENPEKIGDILKDNK